VTRLRRLPRELLSLLRELGRDIGRDVTVSVSAARGLALADSVSVAVQTHMLLHWSDVAIEHERKAWEARREAERIRDETVGTGQGLRIELELRASMIAIAAASHALDALYGELRDVALPPAIAAKWKANPRSGPPRPRKLQETLKHGFRIRGQRWEKELDKLFELRDGAVHPEALLGKPQPHPLGVNTAFEYVVYRCEAATEALDLLFEILETCIERPKPALEQWATSMRASLERLKSDRNRNPRSCRDHQTR